MRMMNFALVVLLLSLGARAEAQESIEFRSDFFAGIGSAHINLGADKYRVYQSITTQIGSFGLSVPVFGNNWGFSLLGNIISPNPVAARIVKLDTENRSKINASANLGIPQIAANALFDGANASSSSIVATVWTMSNPEQYFAQLKQHFAGDVSVLSRDDFRVISSVIMTSTFQTSSTFSFSTRLSGSYTPTTGAPLPGTKLDASFSAEGGQQATVALLGNNIIAYQWSMVCWDNGQPSLLFLDDFQSSDTPSRPATCKSRAQSLGQQ
jgi:hypothetical protein